MEEKRVADYFVVAGLPPENPEPLEEFSEENNLKATHKQDPIVDIAVINKTLGETAPEDFAVIEFTPTNLPADLNHGSIRAPEIYLCYKRGRDKPPITDIGVLYEGKQRVMPGCEVVYHTPHGRPANVNNSNSSRTYITYRRADETAPSDTLAVTDVCIILTNKNENPPHAFCMIGKNLNKGMVGSDVFLCYKKSMCKSNYLPYKPALLYRYPQEDHANFALPATVPLFCLPLGAIVECWPAKAQHPGCVFSTFVLTGAAGEKVYGSAVIFYEDYVKDELSDTQKQQLGLDAPEKADMTVHVNKCICLLSRLPFFDTFKRFLAYLYKLAFTGPHAIPIERHISHFMNEVPFPSPQRPRILVQLDHTAISLAMPEETPLPHSGASFTTLLTTLGPDETMNLLLYTLMEHKILIHSLRHAVLTSVAEAVANMIFPFHWQCPYIPLCPLGLSTVLNAPIPFVVGVDSRYFDLYEPPQDVTCVDLDTSTITVSSDHQKGLSYKILPKRPLKVLKTTLERLYADICVDGEPSIPINAADGEDIDLDFSKHRKELIMETAIQEALLRFMASLLKGYNTFLKPITRATSEATDLGSLFEVQGFLKSREKAYHKFFTHLMKTQLFTRFIEERSFVSDKDASLAFFDECSEKVDENRDEPQLIELEDSHKSARTVFITPPDSAGLPQGALYSYKGFPELQDDLFLHKPKPPVMTNLKTPNCPSSPMARRTKQEIKSAQKIAQKNVRSPELWAKCLLGHCYSLWFIHLPSNVMCVHSKTKALRTAYDVLVRMQQAKLQQPDEVCYRVLLQLCGIYSQPVLAVKVLFEMRRNGLQPNAITYGFYNKALLESEWPTNDTNAYLQWKKLQNVVLAVAQFKQGLKGRRHSMYSNSESDYDRISRASTDSFMDDVVPLQDKIDGRKGDVVSMESPNIEERTSTGGMSDKGYSSMTSEDAKRISLSIGSQESIESLGKVRPMFINKTSSIKENGEASSTEESPDENAEDRAVEMRNHADIVRNSVNSISSETTLRGSTCSQAGLLMTTDASMDESVFGDLGVSNSLKNSQTDERKRHKSEDMSKSQPKSIFRPRHRSGDSPGEVSSDKLSPIDSPVEPKEMLIDSDTISSQTLVVSTANADNIASNETSTTESNGELTLEVDSAKLTVSECVTDSNLTLSSLGSQTSVHSATSPTHSIRTPVTQEDPLGLFNQGPKESSPGDTSSKLTMSTGSDSNMELMGSTSNSESSPHTTPAKRNNLVIELDEPFANDSSTQIHRQSEDTQTTDSGIGDVKCSDSGGRLKIDSVTSSEASSPGSPGDWKPIHQSQSDTQVDISVPPAQSTPTKGKSATLPANMPAYSPARHEESAVKRSLRYGSKFINSGAMTSVATGLFSKMKQLKDTMSTPTKPAGGTATLPKPHEMENHLYEEEEERRSNLSLNVNKESSADNASMEEVPKGKLKQNMQKPYYSTFAVTDVYNSLLASPTVKTLQERYGPSVSHLRTNLSTGWVSVKEYMKEYTAETWTTMDGHGEPGDPYSAAQSEAWRQAEQEIEKRALESQRFHASRMDNSRNANLGETAMLGMGQRRTTSLKNRSATIDRSMGLHLENAGIPGVEERRPRANSLSYSDIPQGPLSSAGSEGQASQDTLDNSSLKQTGSISSIPQAFFNIAMEIEMCSMSKCGVCSATLYDEEIMAGWSADDSNLNTSCQFCNTKLVPFLQIYLKDFRQGSGPVLMTPSQSCESMQSIQSMPNFHLVRSGQLKANAHANRSMTSLNSADNVLSDNDDTTKSADTKSIDTDNKSMDEKSTETQITVTEEATTPVTPTKIENTLADETLSESMTPSSSPAGAGDNDDSGTADKTLQNETPDKVSGDENSVTVHDVTETCSSTDDGERQVDVVVTDVKEVEESDKVDAANANSKRDTADNTIDIQIGSDSSRESSPKDPEPPKMICMLKEGSPERLRSNSECVMPDKVNKSGAGSASTGNLLDEPGSSHVDGRDRKKYVILDPISVPYLSPLVLRKEVENVMDQEGDLCLSNPEFVDEHPIIYWNLVWYFKRLDVTSHLTGFVLVAKSTNPFQPPPKSWMKADNRHVHVKAVWDNPRMHDEMATPMYLMWNQAPHQLPGLLMEHRIFAKSVMQQIVSSIMTNDVITPINSILSERRRLKRVSSNAIPMYSIYRDILYLSFVSLGRSNIDQKSFDKEYRLAFNCMNPRDVAKTKKFDRPPNMTTIYCRRIFGELEI